MALTLYRLADQYRELHRLADDDALDEQALADTLDGLQGEIAAKAANVAKFLRNLEATADAIDTATRQMQDRSARLRRRAEWLRGYLLAHLQAAGVPRVEVPEFVISVRANPPAVEVLADARLPPEFLIAPPVPPPRPDKRALGEALKAGRAIEGCRLIAGHRLEIR